MSKHSSDQSTAARLASSIRDDLLTRSNLVILAGLALVGALGLVGGYDANAEAPAHNLSDGSITVDSSPVAVEVHGVEDGVVAATVTVTDTRSVSALDLGSILRDGDGQRLNYTTLLRGEFQGLTYLSPGVPVDISIPVDGDALQINSLTWRESTLDGTSQYLDPTPEMVVQWR